MRRIGNPAAAGPSKTKPRILYVEDEPVNFDMATLNIGDRYELVWARSSSEACALIRTHQDTIAAVLMDIQLHGSVLDGIDLVRLIRGRLKTAKTLPPDHTIAPLTCPVIFVTANVGLHNDASLLRFGADAVIAKPVDVTRLSLCLSKLIAKDLQDASR